MRKFYLFFAVAALSLSVAAQNEPTFNPQTDPKVIYDQTFESDWDAWSGTSVDTINGVDYFLNGKYNPGASIKIWENKDYQKGFIHRDTLINLYNGVMLSDNAEDFEGGDISKPETFRSKDVFTIVSDASGDASRQQALDQYGTDGGSKYFRFTAGDGSSVKNASGGSVPEYRRNLFVRLTPGAIEENSSYRVTMYVKTTKRLSESNVPNSTAPNFRAELMRGYFSSEKNFSMGRDVSSSNTFYYSKDNFREGEWEKITYMSYYLNNEVAEQFCYYNQYHDTWCDYWKWKGPEVKAAGFDSLHIIRQPNKYFLRISFRGDSTVYDLDNISITKSTIGGIQHTGNMLRVDFGYDTNLKQLALAAKERTNIAAVEVPGKFFTVWGKDSTTHNWRKVEINTAEYHDDGYMYMWSKPRTLGGVQRPQNFDGFDEVRVDFTNPSGVEYDTLALKYSGSLYPNALDEEWVAAGKRVFDFKNELSTPNPNINKGVYPLRQYPPVLRPNGAPYEDGTFGLDPNLRSIKLILSRKLDFDPDDVNGAGNKAFCQVFKNGALVEIWPVQESTDTYTIFKRQKTTPLSGDYTFKFVQIRGVGDSSYSDDIVLNYHFGEFDTNPGIRFVRTSDWRSRIDDYSVPSRPIPSDIWIHTGESADSFKEGNGRTQSTKIGLYALLDDTITVAGVQVPDNVLFYISNRTSGKTGNVYFIERGLQKGNYSISFRLAGRSSTNYPLTVYFYAKPAAELVKGNDQGFALLEGISNKQLLLKEKKPASGTDIGEGGDTKTWLAGTETLTLPFSVIEDGDYIFEFVTSGSSNYSGLAVSNYWITTAGDLSFASVKNLNDAISSAADKLSGITNDQYKGAAFTALLDIKTASDGFIAATSAANKGHQPKDYAAQVTKIEDAVKVMNERIDTVDMYIAAFDTLSKAIVAQSAYADIDAYKKLVSIKNEYSSYSCSRYASADVSAAADKLNAAVKKFNDRIAKTENFAALLESAKAVLDSTYVLFAEPELLGSDLVEYDTLKLSYKAADAKKEVLNTLSDDEFFALADGVENWQKAYLNGMDAVVAKTRQIRELYVLAESLGYDFGGQATKDSIKSLIMDLRKRDAVLENVIREAVVLQIYKKFAAGQAVDSLDVSALIPNYYLYTEGVAGENMEQKNGVWVVKSISGGNKTVLPGWTFSSIGGSNGYWMPTATTVGAGDGHDWAEGHTFISGLRCGPQTSGTINSDEFFMPAGLYTFGLRGYNQTSNVALELISDSCSLGTGSGSSLNGVYAGGKFSYRNVTVDSVKISGNTVINIKQTSASGSEFDMRYFILTLRGALPGTVYADLVSAQEVKLADLITFVPEVAGEAVAVQYFNLNGVQVAAPEAGKIYIKRTILSNGKSLVEKILVK